MGTDSPKMAIQGPIQNDPVSACNAVRNGSLKYAMYRYCQESDQIAVKETGLHDPNAGDESMWEMFLDRLKSDECRYIVYDFVYPGIQDGKEVAKRKLLFILWLVFSKLEGSWSCLVVIVADA